jgi:hypothetical protein
MTQNRCDITLSADSWYRFWSKVNKTSSCWWWTKYIGAHGYGLFRLQRKSLLAHVLAYTAIRGDIQEGFELDHICHHRSCCNPNHLELVTHKVNCSPDRGLHGLRQTSQTHCPNGHEYIAGNLEKRKDGHRQCRICSRARARYYYHASAEVRKKHAASERRRRLRAKNG